MSNIASNYAPGIDASTAGNFSIPPVCDANCQRQKKIEGLKAALDAKSLTQTLDPEGYQKARIDYYTELNGQAWLDQERERIARDEIEPITSSYTTEYNNLKNQTKSQSSLVDMMNSLTQQQTVEDEELQFLKRRAEAEYDKANVIDRLNELYVPEQITQTKTSYVSYILYIVIGLLGIYIVYRFYKRFIAPKPTLMTAGKRVLDKLIR